MWLKWRDRITEQDYLVNLNNVFYIEVQQASIQGYSDIYFYKDADNKLIKRNCSPEEVMDVYAYLRKILSSSKPVEFSDNQ